MKLPKLDAIMDSGSLRAILESKDLAQLGDFLVNFVYSSVKIGIKGIAGSSHVWDSSLRDAMELARMRDYLGKKTKPGRVADAAEAFIGFCYFREVMNLEGMVEFMSQRLNAEDFEIPKIEKQACATAFSELLQHLLQLVKARQLVKL